MQKEEKNAMFFKSKSVLFDNFELCIKLTHNLSHSVNLKY